MNGLIKVGSTIFLVAMFLSLGWQASAAPDVNEAKKEFGEMLKNAQAMVEHGHAAHPAVMTKYAKATIETGQKVLDSLPPGKMEAEAASAHIKAAIEVSKTVISDQNVEDAEKVLNHVTEADSFMQKL